VNDTDTLDEPWEIFHLKRVGVSFIEMCQQTLLVDARHVHVYVMWTCHAHNTDVQHTTDISTKVRTRGKRQTESLQLYVLTSCSLKQLFLAPCHVTACIISSRLDMSIEHTLVQNHSPPLLTCMYVAHSQTAVDRRSTTEALCKHASTKLAS